MFGVRSFCSTLPSTRSLLVRSSGATALTQRFLSTHAHHSHRPSVLVVGGNGALGRGMIDTFKHAGWKTICVDYKSNPISDTNITLIPEATWKANLTLVEESVNELLEKEKLTTLHKHEHGPLAAVVHCAGSWAGGAIQSSSFLESVDPMLDINLKSSIQAAYLAGKFLTDSGAGLLVLTGAAAATNGTTGTHLGPTPGMLSYGMSKAALHQLALSLTQKESGLKNATVICHLPTMIDTPSNRAMASSTSDYENWTPPADFAELTLAFAQQLLSAVGETSKAATGASKPGATVIEHAKVPLKHGGFYLFQTEKGKTSIKLLP